MKTFAALFLLFLAVPAFAAPKIDPKVIGHWRGSLPTWQKVTYPAEVQFNADATMSMTVTMPQQTSTYSGTYTATSGTITETATHGTINHRPTPVSGTQTFHYKFKGDILTMTEANHPSPLILHRVKS